MPTAAEKDLYQKQLAATNAATLKTNQLTGSNLAQLPSTITASDLQDTTPINIPPAQQPTNYATAGNAATDALLEQVKALTTQGDQQNDFISSISKDILGTQDFLNTEATRQRQLQEEAGRPQNLKEVQSGINRLKQLQAEQLALPMAIQEEMKGTGATTGGVAPLQASRQRQLAIEQLRTSAVVQAQLGNIEVADQNIQDILRAEFEPKKQELERLKLSYDMNKDTLERIDKRRAEALDIFLNERTRVLGIEEANKKEIYEVGKLAGKFGADQATVQKIFSATSREEAAALAGSFLQDPMAKQQLENAKLDNALTKLQINKANYELDLLKKYGGMTPSQYAESLKEEKKRIAEEKDAKERARLQGQALNEKVTLLGSVLNSSAIDSVVGPSIFSRGAGTFGGAAGRFAAGATAGGVAGIPLGPIGIAGGALLGGSAVALQGSKDYFTGAGDKLIGQTEQFISKEFLQNLIDIKAQGATFGALTQKEQEALTAAATFIGNRRVYKGSGEDKQVIGYDMSEADFRRELQTIQNLTKKAYTTATGEAWASDEQDFWSQLEMQQGLLNFNPAY